MNRLLWPALAIALLCPGSALAQSFGAQIMDQLQSLRRRGTVDEIRAASKEIIGVSTFTDSKIFVQELGTTPRCQINSMASDVMPSGERHMVLQNGDAGQLEGTVTEAHGPAQGVIELRFNVRDSTDRFRHRDKIVRDETLVSYREVREPYLRVFLPVSATEQRQQLVKALESYAHACERIW